MFKVGDLLRSKKIIDCKESIKYIGRSGNLIMKDYYEIIRSMEYTRLSDMHKGRVITIIDDFDEEYVFNTDNLSNNFYTKSELRDLKIDEILD